MKTHLQSIVSICFSSLPKNLFLTNPRSIQLKTKSLSVLYSQTWSNGHVQKATIGSRQPLLIGPILSVRDKIIKQFFKDDNLFFVTTTTLNMNQNRPKCYQRQPYHFCAACFVISSNIFWPRWKMFLQRTFLGYHFSNMINLYRSPGCLY